MMVDQMYLDDESVRSISKQPKEMEDDLEGSTERQLLPENIKPLHHLQARWLEWKDIKHRRIKEEGVYDGYESDSSEDSLLSTLTKRRAPKQVLKIRTLKRDKDKRKKLLRSQSEELPGLHEKHRHAGRRKLSLQATKHNGGAAHRGVSNNGSILVLKPLVRRTHAAAIVEERMQDLRHNGESRKQLLDAIAMMKAANVKSSQHLAPFVPKTAEEKREAEEHAHLVVARKLQAEEARMTALLNQRGHWEREKERRLALEMKEDHQRCYLNAIGVIQASTHWRSLLQAVKAQRAYERSRTIAAERIQSWYRTTVHVRQLGGGKRGVMVRAMDRMKFRAHLVRKQIDQKKNTRAVEIILELLHTIHQTRARFAMKKYRMNVVCCQRYVRSYQAVTIARRRLLRMAWKRAVRLIDEERMHIYTTRLKDMCTFNKHDVDKVLTKFSQLEAEGNAMLATSAARTMKGNGYRNSNYNNNELEGSDSDMNTISTTGSMSHQSSIQRHHKAHMRNKKLTKARLNGGSVGSVSTIGAPSVYKTKSNNGTEIVESQRTKDLKIAKEAAFLTRRGLKHKIIPSSMRDDMLNAVLVSLRAKYKEASWAALLARAPRWQVNTSIDMEDVRNALLSEDSNFISAAERKVEISSIGASQAGIQNLILKEAVGELREKRKDVMLLLQRATVDLLTRCVVWVERMCAVIPLVEAARINQLNQVRRGSRAPLDAALIPLSQLQDIFYVHRREKLQSEKQADQQLQELLKIVGYGQFRRSLVGKGEQVDVGGNNNNNTDNPDDIAAAQEATGKMLVQHPRRSREVILVPALTMMKVAHETIIAHLKGLPYSARAL